VRAVTSDPREFQPLPAAQFHVLVALTDGEKHGYRLMRDVEAQSDGTVTMGPGTLYGTLKKLCSQGLLEQSSVRPDAALDDERRRYYALTELGAAVCQAEAARLAGLARVVHRNLRARAAT